MTHYDTIIIGAGMSGLAAGIRLAMFDQRVCILERHKVPGGLNSYYERPGRKLDVGLHAMTNFARKGEKGRPLTKLLKQLRIPYEKLELSQQHFSRIVFPGQQLAFSNGPHLLINEVTKCFPHQKENFSRLLHVVSSFDELDLHNQYQSAKERVRHIITDKNLLEMIFYPLLIYGSAWENDMDFPSSLLCSKAFSWKVSAGPKTVFDRSFNCLSRNTFNLGENCVWGRASKRLMWKTVWFVK